MLYSFSNFSVGRSLNFAISRALIALSLNIGSATAAGSQICLLESYLFPGIYPEFISVI